MDLDDLNMWFQACEQWVVVLFRSVMPMVMESLEISQHWDMICYATTCEGGYQVQVHSFEPKDYVYM